MKHILFVFFIFLGQSSNYQQAQVDISEKILGQWLVGRARATEKPVVGEPVDRVLDVPQKTTVYFKPDNTGNFNFPDADSEKFSWKVVKNKIIIAYAGDNELCKSFSGELRAVIRERKGEQKLELSKANFSASLSR